MSAESANPFQAPTSAATPATSDSLPPRAVKKATNLIRDARLAAVVGLLPVLGLIFILRLVQWYLLRRQYPILVSREPGEHADLAKQFRSALSSLWFAVLLWPAVIVFAIIYLYATS
ncbi:MAG TPA: hypothetical protein VGG30_09725 [Pirellulales bacterium]|jgi:hypothetical protein